jgi:phage repressor protein C with HTH and peptisase S24 domain
MLNSEVLAEKVRAALDQTTMPMKDVAAACGVTVAAISEWKRTGRIAKKHLPTLARITNTPLEWWLTPDPSDAFPREAKTNSGLFEATPRQVPYLNSPSTPYHPVDTYVRVRRLLNSLGAGSVELQEFDEVDGSHSFRREWIQKKGWPLAALRVLDVRGNSMSPYINDGDIVLVNTSDKRLVNGEVYAIASDGEAMVKRLFKQLDGKIRVESDNKEYPPDYFTPDREGVILGAVVWRAG